MHNGGGRRAYGPDVINQYTAGKNPPAGSRGDRKGWDPESAQGKARAAVIEKLMDVIQDQDSPGASLSQFALAWLLHQPDVTAPIIGPRTSEQLEDNLGAMQIKLTEEDLRRVDDAMTPGTDLMNYG